MNEAQSGALVFFGATGDLAYKKIFPALQSMVKRGHLDAPVIGVAKSGWDLDRFRDRARDSLEKHGGPDPKAFGKLGGAYALCRRGLRRSRDLSCCPHGARRCAAARPLPAIPPALLGPVVEQVVNAGCTKDARVILESPSGGISSQPARGMRS